MIPYETFSVSRADREPLLAWIREALELAGCRILRMSEPDRAPFRLTFETAFGERFGIVVYAFLANRKETTNRPSDECRFQIKYGSRDGREHDLWQDPFGLYTTLLVGINPDEGYFVAADPVVHSPTRFFISLEFKDEHVQGIFENGWYAWERTRRESRKGPIEVLVGGTSRHFLDLVRFERAVYGLDAGHRQLIAERLHPWTSLQAAGNVEAPAAVPHAIVAELGLGETEILDMIARTPRLKMAVRGRVAEVYLYRQLIRVPGVEDCSPLEEDGAGDIRLRYRGSRPLIIECKNVLRQRLAGGEIRLDFQRTRASIEDPCSRYYATTDFDLVAACLHSCTEAWEFRYAQTRALDAHPRCRGKISPLVRLDERWVGDAQRALAAAAAA